MRELPERLTIVDQPDYEQLLDLLSPPAWHRDAACREHPEVNFFSTSIAPRTNLAAKAVCAFCLAREECLAFALADPDCDGVWGGLTARERRAIRAGKAA